MKMASLYTGLGLSYFQEIRPEVNIRVSASVSRTSATGMYNIGKGPQTFSTVFTHIAGDFGLVAQNPLTENGLLFMIMSSSAVPVWDLIKTRIINLFERKHWLRIYRSVKN